MRVKRPKVVSTRLTAEEYAALDALAGGQPRRHVGAGAVTRDPCPTTHRRNAGRRNRRAPHHRRQPAVRVHPRRGAVGGGRAKADRPRRSRQGPKGARASRLDGEREPVMSSPLGPHRRRRHLAEPKAASGRWRVWLVAMASGLGVGCRPLPTTWTPLQRVYLSDVPPERARADRGRARPLPAARGHRPLESGGRLALDEEVRPSTENGEAMFALSDAGLAAGDRRLAWEAGLVQPRRPPPPAGAVDLSRPDADGSRGARRAGPRSPSSASACSSRCRKTPRAARAARLGRRLKGPELVSVGTFNRRTRGDGVGFLQRPSLIARLLGRRPVLRLPWGSNPATSCSWATPARGSRSSSGSSSSNRGARRGRHHLRPGAREYLCQFYDPARGDVILNPLDSRCPFWSPGDEVRHEAEALTLATSLFPDRDHEQSVFHGRAPADLRAPADVSPEGADARPMALRRGGTRSPDGRHALRRR